GENEKKTSLTDLALTPLQKASNRGRIAAEAVQDRCGGQPRARRIAPESGTEGARATDRPASDPMARHLPQRRTRSALLRAPRRDRVFPAAKETGRAHPLRSPSHRRAVCASARAGAMSGLLTATCSRPAPGARAGT